MEPEIDAFVILFLYEFYIMKGNEKPVVPIYFKADMRSPFFIHNYYISVYYYYLLTGPFLFFFLGTTRPGSIFAETGSEFDL